MVNVLFVCMGNICRSPMAEGVFAKLVEEAGLAQAIRVDSAGTHDYHTGEAPDPRAQHVARQRGVDLSGLRARLVTAEDLTRFDYVLAMDQNNYRHLKKLRPAGTDRALALLLEFAPELGESEVPDPYYGSLSGFMHTLDLIEHASRSLLDHIRRTHGL